MRECLFLGEIAFPRQIFQRGARDITLCALFTNSQNDRGYWDFII